MTTKELIENVKLKVLSQFEHREISGVFVSDMLSDVMVGATYCSKTETSGRCRRSYREQLV